MIRVVVAALRLTQLPETTAPMLENAVAADAAEQKGEQDQGQDQLDRGLPALLLFGLGGTRQAIEALLMAFFPEAVVCQVLQIVSRGCRASYVRTVFDRRQCDCRLGHRFIFDEFAVICEKTYRAEAYLTPNILNVGVGPL